MEHKGDEHKFEQFDVPLELQELYEKAKEGDGFSQYQLGSHYERGEFIAKDNTASRSGISNQRIKKTGDTHNYPGIHVNLGRYLP